MKRFLTITLSVLAIYLSTGCSIEPGGSGSSDSSSSSGSPSIDVVRDEEEGEEPEEGFETQEGSLVQFDLKGAQALALTAMGDSNGGSNLKKISANQMVDVIQVRESKRSDELSSLEIADLPVDLPEVEQIYLGPQGVVVLLLKDPLYDQSLETCYFLHLSEAGERVLCLSPDVYYLTDPWTAQKSYGIPGGREAVQFDAVGNVYYLTSNILYRWNLSDESTDEITNQSITLDDFLVTSQGEVWMKGRTTVGGTAFFRRLKVDGSLEEAKTRSVGNFVQVGDSALLISGNWPDESTSGHPALFELPFDIDAIGEPNFLIDAAHPVSISPTRSIVGHSIIDFQSGGGGRVFALDLAGAERVLLEVFPDEPRHVDLGDQGLVFLKVIDNDIYYVGRDGSGRHLFRKRDVDLVETDEDLLSGENIQVYHFVLVDQFIYFDGLRFSDNKLIIGRIDQNAGNELLELTPLQAELLDLRFY